MSTNRNTLASYLGIGLRYDYLRGLEQAVLTGLAAHVLFVVVFFMVSIYILVAVNITICLSSIMAYVLCRRRMFNPAYIIACVELVVHAVIAVMLLGWESGFHIYILMVVPTLFFPPYFRMSSRITVSSLLGVIYCALYFFSQRAEPVYDLPSAIILSFNYFNMFNMFVLLTWLSYIMHRAVGMLENRLRNRNAELSYLASVDPLTKILNRRSMERFISTVFNTETRAGSQIAFIVADIDHFKTVNDTWGHECGDMVLEEVSRVMAATMREGDRIARWGGEEFLAVITVGSAEGALTLGERMRKAVADSRINFTGHEIAVTATFGVSIRETGEEAKSCIERADSAMYHGKRSGRNRVVAWTPDL